MNPAVLHQTFILALCATSTAPCCHFIPPQLSHHHCFVLWTLSCSSSSSSTLALCTLTLATLYLAYSCFSYCSGLVLLLHDDHKNTAVCPPNAQCPPAAASLVSLVPFTIHHDPPAAWMRSHRVRTTGNRMTLLMTCSRMMRTRMTTRHQHS